MRAISRASSSETSISIAGTSYSPASWAAR